GLLLGLLALVPLGTAAQEGPAATIGEVVVDGFDCETGRLDFHVPVSDLQHIPNSNGPFGATVIGYYEQGESSLPGFQFNPEPENSPYTGNVAIGTTVPLTGEDSIFPEEASGLLTAIEIRARISETDVSSTTYPVECGGAVEPTTPPDTGETPAPTVGDIVIDSYDCETGDLEFHVYVTDLPHDPVDDGSLGYSIVGRYDQGPDSELPASGYNVPAEEAPYTGDLYLTNTMPPTNEGFIYEGSDDPVGSLVSIDISLGVGYDSGDGASDTSSISYPVGCGAAVQPTDPPVNPEPTEPDTGSDIGELIPVCVQGFESTPHVQYLTQAQIDEIEATWADYDQSDIPPPQITGYPDPATRSCATENGVPIDYDPEIYTLVCVASGPEGDGPLVPQLAINHYLDTDTAILADPDTGACSQDETTDDEEAGSSEETGDSATEDASGESVSGDGSEGAERDGADDDDGEVTSLPSTGVGVTATEADSPALVLALGGFAALVGFVTLRLRLRP
ncbi:MAG TPA: hypothetical protein VD789_02205, partial [Thermomicrobiales bacterium]|nr:hypothetical protein [Thermomicrobiales bacterium]